MIELQMVGRMARRAVLLVPAVVVPLWLWNGSEYAVSGAVGLGMTMLNLWVSACLLGGVAERSPQLLLPAALATLVVGLMLLTGIALALRALDVIFFPVTGFVLIGSHLGLVLWEAAGAYDHVETAGAR